MLGKLASYVAKAILQGNKVVVFNCDKINIAGSFYRYKCIEIKFILFFIYNIIIIFIGTKLSTCLSCVKDVMLTQLVDLSITVLPDVYSGELFVVCLYFNLMCVNDLPLHQIYHPTATPQLINRLFK